MPKFLHAADLHVDSPLIGLDAYEGAPVDRLRSATRQALENLVQKAIDEKVVGVIIAGDIFDTNPRVSSLLFFRKQLQRLDDAHIRVALVHGNHDHEQASTPNVDMPPGVHYFPSLHDQPDEVAQPFELAKGLFVHGRSYGIRDVKEDLVDRYSAAIAGAFNIGLLHTALDGEDDGHALYAPTSLTKLRGFQYQYWALGHVHQRKEWLKDGAPVVFPGNLQGRHARETGAKGAVIVEYEGNSIKGDPRHVPLDDVRWFHVHVNAATLPGENPCADVWNQIKSATAEARGCGRLCAIRVTIEGAAQGEMGRLSALAVREYLQGVFGDLADALWLEKVIVSTSVEPGSEAVFMSDLRTLAAELAKDDKARDELDGIFRDLKTELRKKGGQEVETAATRPKPTKSSETDHQARSQTGFLPADKTSPEEATLAIADALASMRMADSP